jgi:hypothetical protein
MTEISESLELEKSRFEPHFSSYFKYGPLRYRLWNILSVAIFSQCSGSRVAGNASFDKAINSMNLKTPEAQVLINSICDSFSFTFAQFGACYVDFLGRRHMIMVGSAIFGVCFFLIQIFKLIYNDNDSLAFFSFMAFGTLEVFIFVYCFVWSPLNQLVVVEILPFSVRAQVKINIITCLFLILFY